MCVCAHLCVHVFCGMCICVCAAVPALLGVLSNLAEGIPLAFTVMLHIKGFCVRNLPAGTRHCQLGRDQCFSVFKSVCMILRKQVLVKYSGTFLNC